MSLFPLTIVTPDGVQFDGEVRELVVRTLNGDMGVMAGHENIVCPLGMGQALIVTDEGKRSAACIGGILTVLGGKARLVPTTFEWADKIDLLRAENAEKRAREQMQSARSSEELKLAEARLKRALIRESVSREAKGR